MQFIPPTPSNRPIIAVIVMMVVNIILSLCVIGLVLISNGYV